ncbi:TIR domain-containing protein [bacterium]|nr:TIR domain-containing protein [bacterium]
MSKPVQIFLCHASEDKPKVVEVYRFLQQQGFKPWLDKEDLLPGQRWDEEIPKALQASDFVLIFLSQISVSKRGYVQREFKLALEILEEIPEGQICVIPIRLDNCSVPDRFRELQYCNLFDDGGLDKICRAIRAEPKTSKRRQANASVASGRSLRFSKKVGNLSTSGTKSYANLMKPVRLRSRPRHNFSRKDVKNMLIEMGFFDAGLNKMGKGLQHLYEAIEQNNAKLVFDRATSLIWQQAGSEKLIVFEEARQYLEQLNRDRFGGYSDWRLPTLEEAISLMEPTKKNGGLHIDPEFDGTQRWIRTADVPVLGEARDANFNEGRCNNNSIATTNYYIRAVRSGQS